MATSFAVIIPTKGRPAILKEALASLAGHGALVTEVIVVDGTADAAQPQQLAELLGARGPRFIYCHAPADSGLPAARNRGIALATADIVQFMDDDTVVEPGFFEQLSGVFADPEVGGCCGLILDEFASSRALRTLFQRYFYVGPFRLIKDEVFLRPPPNAVRTNCLPGASAYRRAVFQGFLFDETIRGAGSLEDLEFSFRVATSWRLMIEPKARMHHYRSAEERAPSRRVFSGKIWYFHYHFRKNMAGHVGEWLAYLWLNFGFAADALVRCKLDPILGVIDGWKRIMRAGLLVRPRPSDVLLPQ